MVTQYGTLARCKTDWLQSIATQDTTLTNLLDQAAIATDNIARRFTTVPLTGTGLTDDVKRLNEKLTAGIYLATVNESGEHPWVKEALDALRAYCEGSYGDKQLVGVALGPRTSPRKDDLTIDDTTGTIVL